MKRVQIYCNLKTAILHLSVCDFDLCSAQAARWCQLCSICRTNNQFQHLRRFHVLGFIPVNEWKRHRLWLCYRTCLLSMTLTFALTIAHSWDYWPLITKVNSNVVTSAFGLHMIRRVKDHCPIGRSSSWYLLDLN